MTRSTQPVEAGGGEFELKNKLTGSCLLAISIIFLIVAPSRVVMPAAQTEQPKTRSLGLGYLLLAESGIQPASMSPTASNELQGLISERQANSLPAPAAFVEPPNYIAIARHEEVYINANEKFAATQRLYDVAEFDSSCTGTIVSDSDYGSFLIYAFSTDVGTSSPITVTDSWVKGLTFNTGPSLLSPGGGQPSGASCDTAESVFVMAVAVNLPSESSWSYDPKSGTFTITVGSMEVMPTFYYLEFYYFAKKTNSDTNFFAKKPSLLLSPSTLVSGTEYIVTSGVSPFNVKSPSGTSLPDWVRIATRIPPWVAQSGEGTWFVGADPFNWDGDKRPPCSFPDGSCSYDTQGSGTARWTYGPPWDVTSANPIQFSWNHIYYGQLVYSGEPFVGCTYKTRAQVGVEFLSIGTDLVATKSSYPNNLPMVTGTDPTKVRISMDGSMKMGTVTDSMGNNFDVYNGIENWIDWTARMPGYTVKTPICD
jgi:hypothetical protein